MNPSPDALAGLAAVVAQAAAGAGRADLAQRLGKARARFVEPGRQILVVGEYKQGKSSLVNALLGADVSPVDDDLATAVPLVVRHAPRPSAAVSAGAGGPRTCTVAEMRSAVVDPASAGFDVRWASVGLPRGLLEGGATIVDTPGIGGLDSPAARLALTAAEASSIVVVVSDVTQELTATELACLRRAAASGAVVLLVLTKIDLTRHWARIAELDRGHLDRAGLASVPVIPTAAPLRRLALERDDRALNDRSGYPALTRALRGRTADGAAAVRLLAEADDVVAQLLEACRTARDALAGPEAAADLSAAVREARHHADALRRGSARWQHVLNDGIASLTADAEYDLRTRLRAVTKEIEAAIGESDPAESWDDVRDLLGHRLAEELAAHQGAVRAGAEGVATTIAEHFATTGTAVAVDLGDPTASWGDGAGTDPGDVELARAGIGAGAFTALRGSYSSVLMFGLLSSFVGLALINPVTIVAGLGMGTKAVRDERERQLGQRRATAKHACRKVVDEVTLTEVKRSRDAVRLVHRELRDGFVARADELQGTLDAAVAAAEQALRATGTERGTRRAAAEAELSRLTKLRADVAALRAATTPSIPTGAAVSR